MEGLRQRYLADAGQWWWCTERADLRQAGGRARRLDLLEPFSLETGDVLDNSVDVTRLNYSLVVAGGGRDGFSFVPLSEPVSCFYATPPNGAQVYLGAERAVVYTPFDLDTLETCSNQPPIRRPVQTVGSRSFRIKVILRTSEAWIPSTKGVTETAVDQFGTHLQ